MDSRGSAGGALGTGIGLVLILVFYAAILGLIVALYWKIATKAGYPGWYALLMFLPCVNLVAIIMFAFQEWPIERELQQWRASGGTGGGAYPRYGQPGQAQNMPPAGPYDPPPYQQ
jgi:hypothetical protein